MKRCKQCGVRSWLCPFREDKIHTGIDTLKWLVKAGNTLAIKGLAGLALPSQKDLLWSGRKEIR